MCSINSCQKQSITVAQLKEYFFEKKKGSTPIYDSYIAKGLNPKLQKYKPVSADKINYALTVNGKLDDYIKYARRIGLENAPTQYWHIVCSYCCRKENLGKGDEKVGSFKCIELLVWMAEVTEALTEAEIAKMVEDKQKNRCLNCYWYKIIEKIKESMDIDKGESFA